MGLEAFLQIPAAGWLIHLVPGDFDIRRAMGRMGEPAMWILGSNFWVWRPCASGVQSQCSSRRPRHLAAQEVPRARWPCSPSNHSTSCTARAACPKVAHGRARGSEEVGPRNLQLGHQICLWINTAKLICSSTVNTILSGMNINLPAIWMFIQVLIHNHFGSKIGS